jgi:iron-sulfur cluster insertion protein
MINVTDGAIAELKKIAIEDKLGDDPHVRLKVMGGGCAGFKYDMYFDDLPPTPYDEVIDKDGLHLVVDPLSMQYLEGVTIDHVKTNFGEGFKFENPSVTKTCGCGESFG